MAIESGLKLLEYVKMVTKEPIELDGKHYCDAVESVEIKESFFWRDACVMCGKCCPSESNAWTQEGMGRIVGSTEEIFSMWGLPFESKQELLESLIIVEHNVNGKDIPVYTCPKLSEKLAPRVSWHDRPERSRCRWIFEDNRQYKCRIHPIRSVTCGIPHIRFYNNKKSCKTTMGVSQFGRNWALKCPIEFVPELDEEGVKSRIYWLTRLKEVADDFGVETFLPEILEYLNAGNRVPHTFTRTTPRKLVNVRESNGVSNS